MKMRSIVYLCLTNAQIYAVYLIHALKYIEFEVIQNRVLLYFTFLADVFSKIFVYIETIHNFDYLPLEDII